MRHLFLLLFVPILASCSGGSSSKQSSQEKTEVAPVAKEWTEVYSFKGNGMKKSPVFDLSGTDARVKYKYKGQQGMGMLAIYVVEQGVDIMKDGGIPELMIDSPEEESETSIQKNAGKYYLNVNAIGNWTVSVEELR